MSDNNYYLSGVNIQDSCANLSAGECAKQSLLKRGKVTSHMLDIIKAKQKQNNSNILVNKIGVLEVDLNTGKLISNKNKLIQQLNGYYVPVNTNNIIQINQHIMNKLTDINFVSRIGFPNAEQAKEYAALLMKDGGGMNDAVINVRDRKENNNKTLLVNLLNFNKNSVNSIGGKWRVVAGDPTAEVAPFYSFSVQKNNVVIMSLVELEDCAARSSSGECTRTNPAFNLHYLMHLKNNQLVSRLCAARTEIDDHTIPSESDFYPSNGGYCFAQEEGPLYTFNSDYTKGYDPNTGKAVMEKISNIDTKDTNNILNQPTQDITTLQNTLDQHGIYILNHKDIHFNHKQRFITIKNNDIISKYTKTKTPSKLYFVVFNMNKNINVNSMGVKEGFTGDNPNEEIGADAPPKPETGYDNGPGWANDEGWLCLEKDSGTQGVPVRKDQYGEVQGMAGGPGYSGDNGYYVNACDQPKIPTDRAKIGLICGDSSYNNNQDNNKAEWTDERNARTLKNVLGWTQDQVYKEGSICDVAVKKLPLMELNTPAPAFVPPAQEPVPQPTPQAAALATPTQKINQPSLTDTTKDKEMLKHLLTSMDDDVNATKKTNKQHVKFLKLQKGQLKLMQDAVAKKKHQLKELKEDSYTNQTLTRFEEYKMKRTLAQTKIMTMLITGVTVCMILVILQKYTPLYYIVPDIIFSSLLSIVTVITIYYLGKSIIDFSKRSTTNFDEYEWHGLNDMGVETTGNAGFDITAFDNIGNVDEITLKFSGKDANMIDAKVQTLKNSKNIVSDLSMLGNNVHVDIVTSDLDAVEERMSDIKNSIGSDLGKIKNSFGSGLGKIKNSISEN